MIYSETSFRVSAFNNYIEASSDNTNPQCGIENAGDYTFSITIATASPPPMQREANPYFLLYLFNA